LEKKLFGKKLELKEEICLRVNAQFKTSLQSIKILKNLFNCLIFFFSSFSVFK